MTSRDGTPPREAVIVLDAAGRVAYWDRVAEVLLGYSASEILGHDTQVLLDQKGSDNGLFGTTGEVEPGAPWTGERALVHRHGEQVSVTLTGQQLHSPVGDVMGTVTVLTQSTDDAHSMPLQDLTELCLLARSTGEIVFASPRFRAVFGYLDAPLPALVVDLVHHQDRPAFAVTAAAAASSADPLALVTARIATADGDWRWVEGSVRSRLAGTVGEVLVLAGDDVTEQVEKADQVRDLVAIVEASPIAIIRSTLDGRITYWSPSAASLFGWPGPEAVGRLVTEVLVPAERAQESRQAVQAATAGQVLQLESTQRAHRDGTLLDVSLTLVPLRDSTGRVVATSALIRDLRASIDARRAVEASERRYRAIVQTAHEAILMLDAEGVVIFGNERAEQMLGPLTDAGRSIYDVIGGLRPDELAKHMLRRARGEAEVYDLEVLDVSGKNLNLMISVSPLIADDGAHEGSVAMLVDITEQNRTRETLTRLALSDPLTGLANRALITDRIAHASARRGERGLAVLFLDLDNFKSVNDSLGHAVGDTLLRTVASRISAAVRPQDTVGRLGGDEFIVVCEDLGADADAVAVSVAERILHSVATPVTVDGVTITPTVSVGVAVADAAAGPVSLLRDADTAMYKAKDAGGGQSWLFHPDQHSAAVERLHILADLPGAAQRGELVLHYQPIIDLVDGQVAGAEALVRWRHPSRGLIAPAGFVPLAEKSGLILELGEWVLREAMRQSKTWAGTRPDLAHVSINLSARQICDEKLVDRVAAAIDDTGCHPGLIRLEITESALMGDVEAALQTLHGLRRLGVSLSIDDFGTGYSSLLYLRDFPVDEIKIGRVFVAELPDSAPDRIIVRAIVEIAHGLGAQICGEGVETPEQWEALRELGSDRVQGYLFDRPRPAAEVRELRLLG